MRNILSVLTLIISFSCFGLETADARRVALVMGNSNYAHTVSLDNPVNDAKLMAARLKSTGFEVTTVLDADLGTMKRAMLVFGRSLRSDTEASLFYYAGHGVQVRGENYLLPTSVNMTSDDEVDLEAININSFLRVMNSSESKINIVILDSCRNNPFSASFRSATRGLAPVLAPKGTYIAYATAPGDIAYDGGGEHSYYTRALADAITIPGLEIAKVFRTVRRSVFVKTQERQVPWESSSIIGEFYFTTRLKPDAKPRIVLKVPGTSDNDGTSASSSATRSEEGELPSKRATPGSSDTTEPVSEPREADPKQVAINLQRELKRIGCYRGAIDGLWGPASKRAIKGFNQATKSAFRVEDPDRRAMKTIADITKQICLPASLPRNRAATRARVSPAKKVRKSRSANKRRSKRRTRKTNDTRRAKRSAASRRNCRRETRYECVVRHCPRGHCGLRGSGVCRPHRRKLICR